MQKNNYEVSTQAELPDNCIFQKCVRNLYNAFHKTEIPCMLLLNLDYLCAFLNFLLFSHPCLLLPPSPPSSHILTQSLSSCPSSMYKPVRAMVVYATRVDEYWVQVKQLFTDVYLILQLVHGKDNVLEHLPEVERKSISTSYTARVLKHW